jgi:hypothetical protein
MTRLDLDPDLERLGAALRASITLDLARGQQAGAPPTAPARRFGLSRLPPRTLAGGTLGLAGVGAALVLVLSAGGAAAPPAFAITTHSDGSVLVQLNRQEDLGQANQKLAAMGTGEQITLYNSPRPTAGRGPVTCTPWPGAGVPNPPVKLIVDTDGTAGSGQSAENTGSTSDLACIVGPHTYTGPYPGMGSAS